MVSVSELIVEGALGRALESVVPGVPVEYPDDVDGTAEIVVVAEASGRLQIYPEEVHSGSLE